MKLYVSKAEDRDQVIVILARNGYTVRQGKEKDPKNNKTVTFVEVIEKRQGLKVACLEEIAFKQGWIDEKRLEQVALPMIKNQYGQYLMRLINK